MIELTCDVLVVGGALQVAGLLMRPNGREET